MVCSPLQCVNSSIFRPPCHSAAVRLTDLGNPLDTRFAALLLLSGCVLSLNPELFFSTCLPTPMLGFLDEKTRVDFLFLDLRLQSPPAFRSRQNRLNTDPSPFASLFPLGRDLASPVFFPPFPHGHLPFPLFSLDFPDVFFSLLSANASPMAKLDTTGCALFSYFVTTLLSFPFT